jgi:hypothetical protein
MDAGDLIRKRKAQATLAGFNSVLQKQGLPTSDVSGCCGYFDTSSCSFPLPTFNPAYTRPNPTVYGTYEYMSLVSEGLVVNGCVPTQVMTMKVQKPTICPSVILAIPVDAAPNATLPIE